MHYIYNHMQLCYSSALTKSSRSEALVFPPHSNTKVKRALDMPGLSTKRRVASAKFRPQTKYSRNKMDELGNETSENQPPSMTSNPMKPSTTEANLPGTYFHQGSTQLNLKWTFNCQQFWANSSKGLNSIKHLSSLLLLYGPNSPNMPNRQHSPSAVTTSKLIFLSFRSTKRRWFCREISTWIPRAPMTSSFRWWSAVLLNGWVFGAIYWKPS